jgi:uncharacterized repeat protein (TIGR03803 family)
MKNHIALSLVTLSALTAASQPFQPQVLYNFARAAGPIAPLVLGPDDNLYGTTPSGGFSGQGTVFRCTPEGVVTTIVNFNGANGSSPYIVGLVANGEFLFGTTSYGANGSPGTVFKTTLNGNLSTLVNFNTTNGASPNGLLLGSDGNLYGTTVTGPNNNGTVFRLSANGNFTPLVNFPPGYGSFPAAITLDLDGSIYGRTYQGVTGSGTVYRVTTNGVLTTIAGLANTRYQYATALTLSADGNFYGTTAEGGNHGRGTAFRVTPQGFITTLRHFNITNGAFPTGPLTLGRDGNFYGATVYGGVFEGTVFKMTPDGDLTTLANFTARSSGVRPYGGVIFGANGSLYGTTITGGSGDSGTVFRVDLPPTILSDPVDQTNHAGTDATFTVDVFGTGPFSYQWLKDGAILSNLGNVSGANTDTLVLANVDTETAGDFAVIVSNHVDRAVSSVARLTVVVFDTDGDGVSDDQDQCPDSAPSSVVDDYGCSIEQLAPCAGPATGGDWKNHGQYVATVGRVVKDFLVAERITHEQAVAFMTTAAQSNCGKEIRPGNKSGSRR